MRQLVFVLSIVFAFSAHGAVYQPTDKAFSFSYDETKWEQANATDASKNAGQDVDRTMAQMTLVSFQRRVADDKYRARFSVVVDSLKKFPGNPDEQLKTYQAHTVDFLKGQRFHIISVAPIKLAKISAPAFEIVANQRDFGLTFRQVVFLKKNEAFLLTAATRTAKFEEYAPETKAFFDSFQMP